MIHFQVSGTGENWLVFVHGLSCDLTDWREQLCVFAQHYRCLSVDLRGHGASSSICGPLDIETHAADVVQLLVALNIGNAVLVGHSMGTRVIASACVQAPERVGGLLFVDGSVQGSGDPLLAGGRVSTLLANDAEVPGFAESMFSMMFTGHSDAQTKNNIMQRAAGMPTDRFREQLRLMMMWDAGRYATVMSQIRVPISILQSTRVDADRQRRTLAAGDTTTDYLEQLKQLVPQATIQIVADCGHFTQLDAVDDTNAALEKLAVQVFAAVE